ncbi:MAG: biotin transporter BioY [Thiomargarita sp.]|nr:biotin transporter BioY [Thiomargarita sp.]
MSKTNQANAVMLTASLGFLSTILYLLLFLFKEPILQLIAQGGWYFLIPITIAFILSYVHGAFVNHFWDVLDVKPNPMGE